MENADSAIYDAQAHSTASYGNYENVSFPSAFQELNYEQFSASMPNTMPNTMPNSMPNTMPNTIDSTRFYGAGASANNFSTHQGEECPNHSLSMTMSEWDLLGNLVFETSTTSSEFDMFA
jgi:hypothetical protein